MDSTIGMEDEVDMSTPMSNQLLSSSGMLAENDGHGSEASNDISLLQDTPAEPGTENELVGLGVSVFDQSQLEQEVMEQVDKMFKEQEEKRRVERASKQLRAVEEDIRSVKQRLSHIEKAISMAPKNRNQLNSVAKHELSAIKMERENKLKHLKKIEAKRRTLQFVISGSTSEVSSSFQEEVDEEELDEELLFHLRKVFESKETNEENLIRKGEMTPFGTTVHPSRSFSIPETTDFDRFLLNEAKSHASKKPVKTVQKQVASTSKTNRVIINNEKLEFQFTDLRATPTKRKGSKLLKIQKGFEKELKKKKGNDNRVLVKNYTSDSEVSCFEEDSSPVQYSDEDVYIPYEETTDDDDDNDYNQKERKKRVKKKETKSGNNADSSLLESESCKTKSSKISMKKLVDDGDQASFLKRIKEHKMNELKKKHRKIMESEDGIVDSDEDDVTEFEEGYKIPNSIWDKLYKYQQTCVRWLWELHQQNCGGIIGDEMGLGKTIQVIAFLVGLSHSNQRTGGDIFRGLGPVLLVCPTTVMHQWVKELHTWWPPFRVAILHDSGSYKGKKSSLISHINKCNGILITSYAGIVSQHEKLLAHDWHYVILDEGHKIRNPQAQAAIAAKSFRTCHRLILSGSPIQNNLKELWSLFDFIFPGKLGTLLVFMQQFSVPIVLGGYANATQMQIQTAYKCASVLRDSISPYLLRRMKSDVKMHINLPDKSEQVLFCQLTKEQINLYLEYINSKEVSSIMNARLQVFVGLINLRKICNHPDLFDGGPKIFHHTDISLLSDEEKYGFYKRSGKMIVVEALLKLWHRQGHRVLLFTQSRQMMDILEIFVKSKYYSYMKMDGSTAISSRQPAINKFNSDPSIFVFLLTTRVGGLGVNLTGANRVIIYDPDWNPSTDSQARERAWRIGQRKQVTIYRLLTAGTIEEKIYHRQIFKQFVTNRVLKDPRQQRFFKSNDLFELFTYTDLGTQGTETSAIFAGTGSEIRPNLKVQKSEKKSSAKEASENLSVSFSEEKREQMKQLAKRLAMSLSNYNPETKPETTLSLEDQSDKTDERNLVDKSLLVEEASEQKTVKKKHKEKISRNNPPVKNNPKKSKKRKAARIEGTEIEYVVKKKVYKPSEDEEEKNKKENDYVLNKLFKRSGVHTALRHDAIVESSAPDYAIVEGEAQRVANEAMRVLRESRRFCRKADEGMATSTGKSRVPRFGQKNRLPRGSLPIEPEDKTPRILKFDAHNEGAVSTSSDLLSAIQKRKIVFGTDGDTVQPPPAATEHDELLTDIRNFVAFHTMKDGQATTQEILNAFKDKVQVKHTAVFKALLKKLCHYSKTRSGEGRWWLREEFR